MTDSPKKADFAPLIALSLPKRIMQIVAEVGGEARFVGGPVRNALLGKDMARQQPHQKTKQKLRDVLLGRDMAHATDIDMATTLTPEASIPLLEAAGLKVIASGVEHGTITVLDPQKNTTDSPRLMVELTTLREDIETHGRRATVRFGTDWLADARRRDFTINALSVTADGTLYDPFDGVADLRAGRIRFVGEAAARIAEDYLRILRFFRFYAWFGLGVPDSAAITAITALADNLKMTSGERIAAEVEKILLARSPKTLAAMVTTGTDRQIAPNGFKTDGVGGLFDLAIPPYFCLGFIIDAGDAAAVAKRLRLSKRAAKHLALATQPLEHTTLEQPKWEAYAWQCLKNRSVVELAYGYATAKLRAGGAIDRAVFERLYGWQPPTLPIRGEDIRQKGVPSGKKIGALLGYGEQHWLNSNCTASRAELLAEVDKMIKGGCDGR